MSERIVKVAPIDDYFSLTWKITNRCNYDCMYCSPEFHDSYSKPPTLEKLKSVWENILDKTNYNGKYKISFTGGEVTTSRSFLPFLRWIREEHGNRIYQILVTSNGSAHMKYYMRLFEYVDNISLSVHSEHIHEKEFFEMVIALNRAKDPSKFLHVNIMNEFWNSERIELYTKILEDHGISHMVNEINYDKQIRVIPIFKGKLDLDI